MAYQNVQYLYDYYFYFHVRIFVIFFLIILYININIYYLICLNTKEIDQFIENHLSAVVLGKKYWSLYTEFTGLKMNFSGYTEFNGLNIDLSWSL